MRIFFDLVFWFKIDIILEPTKMEQNKVGKSYYSNASNKVLQYCIESTTPDHPVQKELLRETLATYKEAKMIGAPECLSLNAAMIRSKNAKKILDIGVFTGASALASALAFSDKR